MRSYKIFLKIFILKNEESFCNLDAAKLACYVVEIL